MALIKIAMLIISYVGLVQLLDIMVHIMEAEVEEMTKEEVTSLQTECQE